MSCHPNIGEVLPVNYDLGYLNNNLKKWVEL
jgi:hypothetical protein